MYTQIAERRFPSANHFICFQQLDLITGQWRVGEQLKNPRLNFGQCGVAVDGVVGDQTWSVSLHAASATLETAVGLNFVID